MIVPPVRFSLLLLFSVSAASPAVLNFGPPSVQESAAAEAANLRVSRAKLSSLQRAASVCSGMRVMLVHSAQARMRRPVELARFNEAETAQMKSLISRMTAVKAVPSAAPNAGLVVKLELLGPGDTVLDSVEYLDVTGEGLVNAQGYAEGSRLLLRGGDATSWHLLMRAEQARAIAANPAPSRQRNRPIRFASIPQPPPPKEESDPFPKEEKEYYHKDCHHEHKHHKHRKKNHYCDHPQKK